MKKQNSIPRMGIIGIGERGQLWLQACLDLEQKNVCTVVATCDPQFTNSLAPIHYQQFEAMFEQESLDIVILAVPLVFRLQMARVLLSHHISVISLGPTTLSVAELDQLENLAKKTGTSVVSTQSRFFDSSWLCLQKAITGLAITSFNFSLQQQINPTDWFSQDLYPIGAWMYLGWDAIQTIQWLLGDVQQTAVVCRASNQIPKEKSALAKIELVSGVVGKVAVASSSQQAELIRIKTTTGLYSLVNQQVWKIDTGRAALLKQTKVDGMYHAQLQSCLEAIRNNENSFAADKKTLSTLLDAEVRKSLHD